MYTITILKLKVRQLSKPWVWTGHIEPILRLSIQIIYSLEVGFGELGDINVVFFFKNRSVKNQKKVELSVWTRSKSMKRPNARLNMRMSIFDLNKKQVPKSKSPVLISILMLIDFCVWFGDLLNKRWNTLICELMKNVSIVINQSRQNNMCAVKVDHFFFENLKQNYPKWIWITI